MALELYKKSYEKWKKIKEEFKKYKNSPEEDIYCYVVREIVAPCAFCFDNGLDENCKGCKINKEICDWRGERGIFKHFLMIQRDGYCCNYEETFDVICKMNDAILREIKKYEDCVIF